MAQCLRALNVLTEGPGLISSVHQQIRWPTGSDSLWPPYVHTHIHINRHLKNSLESYLEKKVYQLILWQGSSPS